MIDINNLFNENKEEKIKKAIIKTKNELDGLTTDTMCMVYTSYLYEIKINGKYI